LKKEQLYSEFAEYYDKIYSQKDYTNECQFIEWAVEEHGLSSGNTMLDMACGTGSHAQIMKDKFSITGMDISPDMLHIGRAKMPDVEFVQGDMKKFNLDQRFSVIICMFSAINYNTSLEELKKTLKNFYQHLDKGGVLIFDLGFNKDNWMDGMVIVDTIAEEGLELARIGQSRLQNDVSHSSFVFLIKKDGKMDFSVDQHELGVFRSIKVMEIMEKVGFETFVYDEFTSAEWNSESGGRPVFVGVK
jgi:ubiquinone/menaquinone biosynthesis C-methylase UbiE